MKGVTLYGAGGELPAELVATAGRLFRTTTPHGERLAIKFRKAYLEGEHARRRWSSITGFLPTDARDPVAELLARSTPEFRRQWESMKEWTEVKPGGMRELSALLKIRTMTFAMVSAWKRFDLARAVWNENFPAPARYWWGADANGWPMLFGPALFDRLPDPPGR